MPKNQTNVYSEEYRVKFHTTNKEGFYIEEIRSYWFASKNKHNQAIAECKRDLKTEGKQGTNFVCVYC